MYHYSCDNQWSNPIQQQWGYQNWNHNPYQDNLGFNDWYNNWNPFFGGDQIRDHGGEPFVVNIEHAAERNNTFRTALWTGEHFQVTLMSIGVGEDIGLENHPNTDQFLRIEQGQGLVQMGDRQDQLYFQRHVSEDDAIMVPAGKWHNLINTGHRPLKLYSIYAPPEHPYGTVHGTKAVAMATEENHYK
ncbi:cupin domain-containing protein [Tenuibacillus multivorans]|uniref:Mannose-6-phosphate isomerase, cupin superfamily n=1 Tax=Tenuibacillus multivorans TaxID=237069 RepID=A0A1H0DZ88_9BACI|nr:cupin domain-containing protein [Tenuibacillus multivorans]GEL76719.1 hypothetical protein TMU01_09540 [Tenuibacillus multivorans]SDN75435.1 Mannose-6-phosphate isomerase, cupin superfamily [Tenuibacillus multivorans]